MRRLERWLVEHPIWTLILGFSLYIMVRFAMSHRENKPLDQASYYQAAAVGITLSLGAFVLRGRRRKDAEYLRHIRVIARTERDSNRRSWRS